MKRPTLTTLIATAALSYSALAFAGPKLGDLTPLPSQPTPAVGDDDDSADSGYDTGLNDDDSASSVVLPPTPEVVVPADTCTPEDIVAAINADSTLCDAYLAKNPSEAPHCGEPSMQPWLADKTFTGVFPIEAGNYNQWACGDATGVGNSLVIGGVTINSALPLVSKLHCPTTQVCGYKVDALETVVADTNSLPTSGRPIQLDAGVETVFKLSDLLTAGYITDPDGDSITLGNVSIPARIADWAGYDSTTQTFTFLPTAEAASENRVGRELNHRFTVAANDGTSSVDLPVYFDIGGAVPTVAQAPTNQNPTGQDPVAQGPTTINHPWQLRLGALYLTGPSGSLTGGTAALAIPLANRSHPFHLVPSIVVGSMSYNGQPQDSTTPITVDPASGTNYVAETDQGTLYNVWTRSTDSQTTLNWDQLGPRPTLEGQFYLGFPELRTPNRVLTLSAEAGVYAGHNFAAELTGTSTTSTTHTTEAGLYTDTEGNGTPDTLFDALDTVTTREDDIVTTQTLTFGGPYVGVGTRACLTLDIPTNKLDLGLYGCGDVGYSTDGLRGGGQGGINFDF